MALLYIHSLVSLFQLIGYEYCAGFAVSRTSARVDAIRFGLSIEPMPYFHDYKPAIPPTTIGTW